MVHEQETIVYNTVIQSIIVFLWKFKHINEASGSKNLTFQKSLFYPEYTALTHSRRFNVLTL